MPTSARQRGTNICQRNVCISLHRRLEGSERDSEYVRIMATNKNPRQCPAGGLLIGSTHQRMNLLESASDTQTASDFVATLAIRIDGYA